MDYQKIPYDSWTNEKSGMTYLFYKTKDESVSVSLKSETVSTELMHSVDGAFSETVYLYQDIIQYALKTCNSERKFNFLSLGLGLGYVEIMVCAYFLKHCPNENFTVFSYEENEDLRNFFYKFIFEEQIPAPFQQCYESILQNFSQLYSLEINQLKNELKRRISQSQILLEGSFSLETKINEPIHGLFFDAFSINTSPDLWEDSLLHHILGFCDEYTSFATYAARTHLKRVLLEHRYQLAKKKGYGGKKESTFAFRP